MKYLLDTHTFIWWLEGNKKLKISIRKILESSENQILVSVVSGIEISIKSRSRKLNITTTVKKMFEISGFKVLNVDFNHVLEFNRLPFHPDHKDPFDRILIAQVKAENLTLITSDQKIWKYKISLLKA